MSNKIKQLKAELKALKAAEKQEKTALHKDFSYGDIVTNGTVKGRVEWTKNKSSGHKYTDGVMYINYLNQKGGAIVNRNDFEKVTANA